MKYPTKVLILCFIVFMGGHLSAGVGWNLIWETNPSFPLAAGQDSGPISFNPGKSAYELRFEFLRDVITGGDEDPITYARVVVKDGNGATLLDKNYDLPNIGQTYAFQEVISSSSGTQTITVYCPTGFYQYLRAKTYWT
ncbi:MAG: hypothetical protein KF749_01710 [Bacteroidetes bacterium]|nr:hypothetical protein [Bacteroidota bacterium]MCW5896229.1 hypothetical protein [Bacteroidota bacterium]